MKYVIMAFGDQSALESRSTDWISRMIDSMTRIDRELAESGELVLEQGLVDPAEARTLRFGDGHPTATDGPFARPAESLAGIWIVDVDDEARAVEIGSEITRISEGTVEVRRCADAPEE